MGSTVEMIDIHSHILPGLDDGAQTMEEAIRMCQIAYEDGVRTMIATPHTLNGIYENGRSIILRKVEELNSELRSGSTGRTDRTLNSELKSDSAIRNRHSAFELKILPGSDVHLCETTLRVVEQGEAITVGDGGKYILIEFPFQAIPHQAERVLFQLLGSGVIPIISHPERNLEIVKRPDRFYEIIRMGCLGQVTAMSLTGEFGSRVRQCAEKLLRGRLVHLIASDAHSENGRPPILSAAVKAAAKIVGAKEAERMVTEYPEAILEGGRPGIPEPIPI